MKLSSSIYKVCVFSIVIIFGATFVSNVQAQDATNGTTPPPPPQSGTLPPPPPVNGDGQNVNNTTQGNPPSPVARIRATVENIAGKNRALRNTELQGRENGNGDSSSTPPGIGRPFPPQGTHSDAHHYFPRAHFVPRVDY